MPSIPYGGLSPASAYTITGFAVQERPPAILADKVNPITREIDSISEGHTIADGMVIHLINTHRGTGAAVAQTGHRLRELRHVDDRTTIQVESLLAEALKPARDARVAQFTQVVSEVDQVDKTQVNSFVEYRDLSLPPTAPKSRQLL